MFPIWSVHNRCGRKFVLCLFLHHMSQLGAHINELYVPVYSGRRTCCLEEIPVLGACRPNCHAVSLYLFVLVLFFDAVVFPQVGPYTSRRIAFTSFYEHIVHVDWGVFYNNHLCLCDDHLQTHLPTLIG